MIGYNLMHNAVYYRIQQENAHPKYIVVYIAKTQRKMDEKTLPYLLLNVLLRQRNEVTSPDTLRKSEEEPETELKKSPQKFSTGTALYWKIGFSIHVFFPS